MPTPPAISLSPELAAFIQSGVSIYVASRDAVLHTSLVRALGCCVAPDRTRITLLLSKSQSIALLDDLQTSDRVAAVFTQPSTHRTLQLKGSDIRIGPARPLDEARARSHHEAVVTDVMTMEGYDEGVVRAVFSFDAEDLVGISFRLDHCFSQTPGPDAGARIA